MQTQPWYRQPWPWFLISLPALAVAGGIVTVILALRTSDGVVAPDYYKRGLAINEELSRRERAGALGVKVSLSADSLRQGDRVTVRVASAEALPQEATLQVRLVHPARSGSDRVAVLARMRRSDDGREAIYSGIWRDGQGEPPAGVAWHVAVETASWRVDADATVAPGATVVAEAAAGT